MTPTVTATPTVTPSVGLISGKAFRDDNGNSQPDSGEGLAGAIVTLVGDGNPTNLQATTGSDGSYSFPNLAPGNYLLTETAPPGYGEGKPISSLYMAIQAGNQITRHFRHELVATLTPTPTGQVTPTPTSTLLFTDRLFMPMLLR